MDNMTFRERYIDPRTDFGFKKLFGTELNKELLISFLSALLPDQPDITDIRYLNTEHLPDRADERRSVFDVYCVNQRGEHFLVEMQRGMQRYFKERSLYYSTFPIREQAGRGDEWNYNLKAVYVIGILSFSFEDGDECYHTEVKLMNTRTQKVFYDKLTFVFLELPKFRKKESELVTMFDKWVYVLCNLAGLMERPAALQERVFTRLFKAAEIAGFTRPEVIEYEDSLKVSRDWYSVLKTAREDSRAEGLAEGRAEGRAEGHAEGRAEGLEQGRAEGRAEGLEQGRMEERLSTARNLKKLGIAPDTIVQATGLSLEEIEKL